MNKKKLWWWILLLLPMIGLLIWAYIENMSSSSFYEFSLMDLIEILISIFVGIAISIGLYYYSNINDNKRLLKLSSIAIFEKMECLLCNDIFALQKIDFSDQTVNRKFLSCQRSFSNCISTVNKYEEKLLIKDELQFIKSKFGEIKTIADICFNHKNITEEDKCTVSNIVDLINHKIMEIRLKIYS